MKFYLINPSLPLSFTSNEYGAPMVFRKYSTPPLGLLTAAAYYATKTVDLATSPKPRFDFVSVVLVIAVSTERDLDDARTHQARGEVSIDCRERRLGGVRAA
jgi:hypothetical protein